MTTKMESVNVEASELLKLTEKFATKYILSKEEAATFVVAAYQRETLFGMAEIIGHEVARGLDVVWKENN